MIIYYNPECSKCQQAHDLLEKNNCEIQIREYLKDPPTEPELKALVEKIGCRPFDIVRRSEALYIEKYIGKNLSDQQWIKVLANNPVLIERPIVINGSHAIVGRPPTLVLDLIKNNK